MLTKEQEAELRGILGSEIEERIKEAMAKVVDRKFVPGGGASLPSPDQLKSLGEYLWTIRNKRDDVRLKALAEGVDSTGGFLVPEEFRATLLALSLERAVVRPYATKIPMTRDVMNIPRVDETSHASHLFGGIIAYWTEEAGTKAQTDPLFAQTKLTAYKLTGATRASDELLDDSAIALEALLVKIFGSAIAWFEDLAFLRGSGVGQPLGVFNSGAVITTNRAVANQVALADLADIMARMFPDSLYQPSTLWVISPAVLAQLIPLTSTCVAWLPNSSGIASRIPGTILGMPFMVTEKVPTLGTTGDIGLYDFSYYLIGDRKDLRVDASTAPYFLQDQTAWRFVERVAGHPWLNSAFTPYNGGNTLSPFVQLHSSSA